MLRTRVIPALLLRDQCLVKTRKFDKYIYVGDPCNTVRIFNELEVDELLFLDILASQSGKPPDFGILENIANECFMPLGYGGGVTSMEDARSIYSIGFEKVVVNTHAVREPQVISDIAGKFGSQAIVVSIDVRSSASGEKVVHVCSGRENVHLDPIEWAIEVERLGAGEILLTSIDREGTWSGFDSDLVQDVADAVNVPVIAHGGAGTMEDIRSVTKDSGASAVALGSMVVFQKQGMGVLVNFPNKSMLEEVLS